MGESFRLTHGPLVYMQILQMLLHDPYLRVKNRKNLCEATPEAAPNESPWNLGRHLASNSTVEIPFFIDGAEAASPANKLPTSSSEDADAFSIDCSAEEYLAELGRLPADWKSKLVMADDQLRGSAPDVKLTKEALEMSKLSLTTLIQEVHAGSDHFAQSMAETVRLYNSMTCTTRGAFYVALPLQALGSQFQYLGDNLTAKLAQVVKAINFVVAPCSGFGPTSPYGNPDDRKELQDHHQNHLNQQLSSLQDQEQPWRPQRGLPEHAVIILRNWLFENFLHPYPKDAEKVLLARQTGLSRNQVSNWFINARVRLWKPMVEDMYDDDIPQGETTTLASHDSRLQVGNHQLSFSINPPNNQLPLPLDLAHSEPSQYEFFSTTRTAHDQENLGNLGGLVGSDQASPPNLYTGAVSDSSRFEHAFGNSSDLSFDWHHQPHLFSPSTSTPDTPPSAFGLPLGEAFTRFHPGSGFRPGSAFLSNSSDFPMAGVSLTLGLTRPDLSSLPGGADSSSQPLQNYPNQGFGNSGEMPPSSSHSVFYNIISGAAGPIQQQQQHSIPEESTLGRMDFMQLGTNNELPPAVSPVKHLEAAEKDLYDLTQR